MAVDLSSLDKTQIDYLSEECICVDRSDNVIGSDTKKNCHLNVNIEAGKMHRAFSVFLFNSEGKLLLQQRSEEKITFPGCFTNTCCSHPLYRPNELEENNCLGVKNAAVRKLEHELGISPTEVSVDELKFLSRFYYKAPSNDIWGEHEIDYILILKKDVALKPNPNEVMSQIYVNQDELRELLKQGERGEVLITPWFKLLCEKRLFEWWDSLDSLDSFVDENNIQIM